MSRVVALLLAALLLVGCVPASPDVGTYDDKARLTLGSAVSEVRTTELLLRMLDGGKIHRQSAITQMRYSEGALGTAVTAFTELNPPPARDRFTARTSQALGDAQDLLDETRTAIERYRGGRYPVLADELADLAGRLEDLEGQAS